MTTFFIPIVISTHAPRTGSDLRGARRRARSGHFNPRSPHGERQEKRLQALSPRHFNPRSPHGERHRVPELLHLLTEFQPTLPARGATTGGGAGQHRHRHFNPRSPHGERRVQFKKCRANWHFNPRSPHGERRGNALISLRVHDISTHAPRTGSDRWQVGLRVRRGYFNPRSPHGERRRINPYVDTMQPISTHAPRTGSDIHPML